MIEKLFTNEKIILFIVAILGIMAAVAGKWDMVGIVIGGAFALLKGDKDEKNIAANNPVV